MQNKRLCCQLFSLVFVPQHKYSDESQPLCGFRPRHYFISGPLLSMHSDFASFKENKSVPSRWLYFSVPQPPHNTGRLNVPLSQIGQPVARSQLKAWASKTNLVVCSVFLQRRVSSTCYFKVQNSRRIRSMTDWFFFLFVVGMSNCPVLCNIILNSVLNKHICNFSCAKFTKPR